MLENGTATFKRIKKLYCFLKLYTKINTKWIRDLKLKPESIKLSNIFLAMLPQARIRAKINKWDYINQKLLHSEVDNQQQQQKIPSEREKIFLNGIFNKGLIIKTYKELIQLKIKKNKQPD